MKTQAEIVAQKIVFSNTCINCTYSKPEFKRGQPVLKCVFTGRIVSPNMIGCPLWERKLDTGP